MAPKQNQKPKSAAESIIITQSVFLMAFGMAGFMAASTVVSGFKAITNANSAVALITEGAIVTESEAVSLDQAKRIISNFELVCTSALAIGSVVLLASLVRMLIKARRNNG
jgi:hypothetical protein